MQSIRRHAVSFGPDDRSPDKRHLDAAKDLLLGRSPFPFGDDGHCRPGCDCRPMQPAPCGADITVLVPLGAALGTTDELAELVGHGPLEPDLLRNLLLASPLLRAVFVDEQGVPVADSPLTLRPPRLDPAALRDALLRLAHSSPGPRQPRHPDDHHHQPDTGPPGDDAPQTARLLAGSAMSLLQRLARQVGEPARAAADTRRPTLPDQPHPAGTPGGYRIPRRMARLLRARRARCEWPGCGAHAVRCDVDHDLAWPNGPTCPCKDNRPERPGGGDRQLVSDRLPQVLTSGGFAEEAVDRSDQSAQPVGVELVLTGPGSAALAPA